MQGIKNWWKKVTMTAKQKKQLKDMKRYYTMLREGAEFIMYVRKDLEDQQNKMNRHARRRIQKSLVKGEITPEIVKYYAEKIDVVLMQIDRQLNPPKAGQVKINGKRV